jgi:hypothetical protein
MSGPVSVCRACLVRCSHRSPSSNSPVQIIVAVSITSAGAITGSAPQPCRSARAIASRQRRWAQLGPNAPSAAARRDVSGRLHRARKLRQGRVTRAADLGVKGSRVQISPARQAKHLVKADLKTCEKPRGTAIFCFDNRSDNRVTISGDRRDAARAFGWRTGGNMPARRTKRADGRYSVTVRLESLDGTARRMYFYGRTQAEARVKAAAARERVSRGEPVRDATRTLSDWLAEWRTTFLHASDRAESTKDLYAGLMSRHFEPLIGHLALGQVKPSDITRVLAHMERLGRAASTRRNAYAALRSAFDDAVIDGLLAASPVLRVRRPKATQDEATSLTPDEVAQLLRGAAGLRYASVIRLILGTGLRRGEARSAGRTSTLTGANFPSEWSNAPSAMSATKLEYGCSNSSRRLATATNGSSMPAAT